MDEDANRREGTPPMPPRRPSASRLARVLPTLGLVLGLSACGGDSSEPGPGNEDDEAPTAEAPQAAPSTANRPDPDVRGVDFAPSLQVDLDAMEPRPSGLHVQVLEEGEGPRATAGDSMWVHYTVWFADGRTLDSSHDHDPPAPLPMVLGETPLIEGWTEGVTAMRSGERRRLVVPYDLAYGATGRPGVPPYSTLVFEVELTRHVTGS